MENFYDSKKIEEKINSKIDIPNLTEPEEGYIIHLLVSLVIAFIYFYII